MIRRLVAAPLRRRALNRGKSVAAWRRLGKPTTAEWTAYLKQQHGFHSFGEDCFISADTIFTNPEYTSIGNNVRIAGAWISGHDGSVNMLNRAFGTKLDAVGPVTINDDVFIGRGVTILPGVTIGPRAIVGAGTVVSNDVPENSVVAGNPARFIRTLDEHVEVLKQRTAGYPWSNLIAQRNGGFDPRLEPELKRLRAKHFFGKNSQMLTSPSSKPTEWSQSAQDEYCCGPYRVFLPMSDDGWMALCDGAYLGTYRTPQAAMRQCEWHSRPARRSLLTKLLDWRILGRA